MSSCTGGTLQSRHTLQILASPALHLRSHRMALQHGTAAFGPRQEETGKLCTKISMTSSLAATPCTRISFLGTPASSSCSGSVPLPAARPSRQRTKKITDNYKKLLAAHPCQQLPLTSEYTKSLRPHQFQISKIPGLCLRMKFFWRVCWPLTLDASRLRFHKTKQQLGLL